jgi:hypothetical protein
MMRRVLDLWCVWSVPWWREGITVECLLEAATKCEVVGRVRLDWMLEAAKV